MMTSVELPDGTLAIAGLSWESFGASDWKKQRKHRGKTPRAVYEVGAAGQEKEVLVGEAQDDLEFQIPPKSVSLAVICARSFPKDNVTIVEKLGDDLYWFCAANQERVIAGTDIVGPLSEIFGEVTQHQALMAGASEKLVGSGIADVLGESAESVLDQINTGVIASGRIKGSSGHAGGSSVTPAKLGILVAVFVALGYGIYITVVPATPAQPAQSAAEIARKQRVLAQSALSESLRQKAKQIPISQTSRVFNELVGRLPTTAGGWTLQETKCNVTECQSRYSNDDFTAIQALESAAADLCERLEVGTNGTEAMCSQSIGNYSFGANEAGIETLLVADGGRRMQDAALAAQSVLGGRFRYELKAATPMAFNGRQHLPPETVPLNGDWSMTMDIGLIHEVGEHFIHALPAGITGIITNWADRSVQISGQYYESHESKE